MTMKIAEYFPLAVGPQNSVWPASHIEFRDGRWVELVDDPVCIATFARDQIGTESARLLVAASNLLTALKKALEAHDYDGREGWVELARSAVTQAENG